MKVKATKPIKIVSRTLEITKRPKARNLGTGNVSISETERSQVKDTDTVIIKVFSPEEELIKERIYTGAEFHRSLVEREKRSRYGSTFKYFTIRY